jgi:hypothetical protein
MIDPKIKYEGLFVGDGKVVELDERARFNRRVAAAKADAQKPEPVVEEPKQEPKQPEQPDEARESVEEIAKRGEIALIGVGVAVRDTAILPDMLAAMNDRHAVVGNVGGKCRIVEWVPSEVDPGALIASFQSKTDFINRYAQHRVGWTRRGDPLTLGQWWFEHPRRADHRGVVFQPGAPNVLIRPESGSWLNIWRGWGVTPQRGRWPLLRDHLEQILSAADPVVADYNLRWAAWGFQHPGEQAEAALVFRGKKGVGKGLWLGTMRVIYGPHGLHITHAAHLTGQFNAHLWTCLYVFADEAFWAGDKQGEAVLKGLITERPMMVTKKGVDSVPGLNRVKLGIAGNMDWVVPASEDERRFAVSDTDNRYAKGVAPEEERKRYFGPIYRELAEGGAAAMLYDLLQMNLGDWHPREVPTTAGLMRQKKESLRGNHQWFEALLQSGTLPANMDNRPNRIVTEDLVAYVQTFRGLDYATDESIAGFLYREMGLRPELAPQGNRCRESNGGRRGWEFPPLGELRERWETKFGGQWDWHEKLTEWQLAMGNIMDRSITSFRR